MGLLTWMQLKAASVMGSKLGGELITAAKEGYRVCMCVYSVCDGMNIVLVSLYVLLCFSS